MGFVTSKKRIGNSCRSRRKLLALVLSGVLSLLGALLLVIIDPIGVISDYYGRVTNGSYVHGLLKKESPGVHLETYLFNITNPQEFMSGEDHTLKLKEVGPFTYQEFRSHDNLEVDEVAEVVRYTPRINAVFLPEHSVGRPEDIQVTMPNIALLSVASKVSTFSYIPRMAFNLLTTQLQSKAIVNMSAYNYLWGYEEPLIKLGNNLIPQIVNFDILGILDRLYDKKAKYNYEVSARKKDKFVIKSVNGVNGLSMWDYENPDSRSSCNSFENSYEGISYPPDLKPDRPLKIYRNILCRFLDLDFVEKRMMEYGVDGLFYKMSNSSFTRNNSTDCLCKKGVCYDGISDLTPCFYGLPLVLSNAHFMYADPKLYERVDGMRPNEEDHGSGFTIDPKLGLVLTTQFSVQVNILVRDVGFNYEASKFSDMVVPVAYFKIIQPPLQADTIHDLRLAYIYGPNIVLSIQGLLVFAGLVLLAFAGWTFYGLHPERKTTGIDLNVKEWPSAEQSLM